MGRSTRFFGARVLRSGRRVWTGPAAENFSNGKRSHFSPNNGPVEPGVGFDNEVDELVDLKNVKIIDSKVVNGFESESDMIIDDDDEEESVKKRFGFCEVEEKEVEENVDKMYGIVYRRKRKRGKDHDEIQYFRRKKSKRNRSNSYLNKKFVSRRSLLNLSIVVGSCGSRKGDSGSSYMVISCLMHSILRYFWKADMRLRSLSAFVRSEPLVHVFAAHGVRFLQNFSSVGEVGSCIINNVRSSIPVFSVDFAALPFVFLHLHSSLSLRYARPIYFSETYLSSPEDEVELNTVNNFSSFKPLKSDHTGCEFVVDIGATVVALPALGGNNLRCQSVDISKGCKIQKTTNSVRKRGRSLSISPVPKSNGASLSNNFRPRPYGSRFSSRLAKHQSRGLDVNEVISSDVNVVKSSDVNEVKSSDVKEVKSSDVNGVNSTLSNNFRPRHYGCRFSARLSKHQSRGSDVNEVISSAANGVKSSNVNEVKSSDVNEVKSTLLETTQKIRSASCSANILVIESAKCYRVEGAFIVLELSSESNQWFLAIRKDGVKWYSITVDKVMRPCGSNRVTHDIIWSRDNDLKLEFPIRQDWLTFKELYKECFDRNLQMPVPTSIPVPRVCEVEGYGKFSGLPFMRPPCYISVKDDELARALKKRTANYDMDSDDEEWLRKFNSVSNAESDIDEYLSAERFELMIDAFEKACHCNPDVITNAETAYSIFPELEREVVEAVYGRWIMKRKSNRAALVRVFQFYQPRKSQLISKFNSRKKRSFKRQGSQAGRGQQRSFIHAFVVEQDAIEQQNALKVQEAKATLDRLESLASQKRRRAQELFANADLAAYKALMALRIAEAAQHSESTHVAASYVLR